ncbi:MAG: C4-dicarboxylate TRAP transporter substrate-binding protein [Treponema sp.]|nr:C4-dicarboxylate TRAP transporter substrate-binding protein [Treponema sp.]
MKLSRSFFVLAVALIVSLGFTSCRDRDGGAAHVLMMSTQLADTSPMVGGFRAWADAVYERTNGNVRIDIFTNAVLGSDEDVIEQALQGVNVAVLTDGGRMANYVRDIGIIGMAYIANDYEELTRITQTPTFRAFDAELRNQGIRILSYNWYDGPRNFFTNTRVYSPSDLSGVRIRTPGAPVWSRSVASLGATPVAMPWPESYNALQTRVIDGVEVQSTAAYPARMHEVTNYIIRTEHFQLANFIMVGERWFSTLPAQYQQILIEECNRAAIANAAQILAIAADFERRMVANGMEVIYVDRTPFIDAAERAFEELGFLELRDQIWSEIGRR